MSGPNALPFSISSDVLLMSPYRDDVIAGYESYDIGDDLRCYRVSALLRTHDAPSVPKALPAVLLELGIMGDGCLAVAEHVPDALSDVPDITAHVRECPEGCMVVGMSPADEAELGSAVAMHRIVDAHKFVDDICAIYKGEWKGTDPYILAEEVLGWGAVARGLSATRRFRDVDGIRASGVGDGNGDLFAYMRVMEELGTICKGASFPGGMTCLLPEARRIRAATDAVRAGVSAHDAVAAALTDAA